MSTGYAYGCLAAGLVAAGWCWLRQAHRQRQELREVLRLINRNNSKRTLASLAAAVRATARSDDVFIATFPKVGTTVLQQMSHQLRAGGEDWEFEEISQVAPWWESLTDSGGGMADEQRFQPRLFKSHLSFELLPSAGRVITVLREPAKVLESYYHFYGGYKFNKAALSLDGFARWFWANRGAMRVHGGTYYEHICSYWKRREDPRLLILFYEDILDDAQKVVERVAQFIGITDQAVIRRAAANSTREAMLAHGSKFDDAPGRRRFNRLAGMPEESGVGVTSKVNRAGGKRETVSVEVAQLVNVALWAEVHELTGCPDYASLRASLKA